MILYIDGKANTFNIPKETLLAADSGIPHEVLPVKSGYSKNSSGFF